nr:MAG TPA: hypothetical protein [Caudoviricetes sp.]
MRKQKNFQKILPLFLSVNCCHSTTFIYLPLSPHSTQQHPSLFLSPYIPYPLSTSPVSLGLKTSPIPHHKNPLTPLFCHQIFPLSYSIPHHQNINVKLIHSHH